MDQQKLLNWLTKEKQKDNTEIEKQKSDFASQLLKKNKNDLFKTKKQTLWMKMKKILWGI